MALFFSDSNGSLPFKCLALILCALLVSMVAAGCLSNGGALAAPNTTGAPSAAAPAPKASAPPSEGNSTPFAQTPAVNSSKIVVAENKTGIQKTNETIASIVPDGNYEKQLTYAYHSGNTVVEFKLSIQNDTITSASATGIQPDKVSDMIIKKFNGALPDLVVGKKINELSIPHNVAGSSLTTAAFKKYAESLVSNHGQPSAS